MTLRDSREMNYIASSKTWAGSATHVWTRCPRRAWPHGSLIIKYYRVQEGNHHRGYRSPCISLALRKELLLLEQINKWLGVLRNTYGVEVINLPNHSIPCTCVTNLGWFQGSNIDFIEFMAATYIKCMWIWGSHFLHPNICFMNGTWR